MIVKMTYDDELLGKAVIPDDIKVTQYAPKDVETYENEEEIRTALREKLLNPIGMRSLADELAEAKKILILSDDNTRTTNSRLIIEEIVRMFPEKKFTVIICLGTHRLMTDEEIVRKLGEEILEKCSVTQHDWQTATYHDFGRTESGIPVLINDIIDDFDYIIGTGQIVPHRCTGFSAGSKIVQPGISAGETTEATHWLSARFKTKDMMGKRDNPVREELDEIASRAGLKFLINVVQDSNKQIVGIFCGDPVEAHRSAAIKAAEIFGFKVEPVEIVISESHPADIELWQASKGIYSAVPMVKPGGTLILVTPCPEGISKTFGEELLKFGYKHDYEDMKKYVDAGLVSNKILAAHIVHAGEILFKAARVLIVTPGINREDCEKLGLVKVESLQEAINTALGDYENPEVAVMKYAADLLPVFD